jgi:glutathione transport system permease protein
MFSYMVRRICSMIPILVVVAMLVFLFLHMIPGDPARIVAGPEASLQDVEMVRHDLGLDRPLQEQFLQFTVRSLHGDFGKSYQTHEPVANIIQERILPTLELSACSMLWAVAAGIFIGVTAATRRGKWQDKLSMFSAVAGISVPSFWLGLMLMEVFAVGLGWLPSGGNESWQSYILPSITLGSGVAAVIARFTRTSLLETLREDYVRTARAKGAGEIRVIWLHALRNALLPVVTMIGLQFGFLLGGSIVIESVFSWPGMGKLLIDAVNMRDYPIIQAEMLLFSFEFLLINLLVDLLYAKLNPQIRLDS